MWLTELTGLSSVTAIESKSFGDTVFSSWLYGTVFQIDNEYGAIDVLQRYHSLKSALQCAFQIDEEYGAIGMVL